MMHRLPILLLLLLLSRTSWCQETVFSLLKTESRRADEYYAAKNYKTALDLYANLQRKKPSARNLVAKIARCYFFLREYAKAVAAFEVQPITHLQPEDLFYYAESLTSNGNYEKAIDVYRAYREQVPDDLLAAQKMWRLNNIQFLYEDSIHCTVKQISLNTTTGELCPVPFQQGLVFLANYKEVKLVEKIDATLNAPFYKMYFAAMSSDSASKGMFRYAKPIPFSRHLTSGFHAGPVAFYQHGEKMVFASTGNGTGVKSDGKRLHLYFAEKKGGRWETTAAFPYNSNQYSITDPTIHENGTVLFFSSDMKGGLGGKDIYRSQYSNGRWTTPENLGETINTVYDEMFPFLHSNEELYFSSNGHPGMGGLDIFRTRLLGNTFDEVFNAGYPMNSHADEFGIWVDSLGARGYFSSNRKNGGHDDDMYEFDVDLQPYPLDINGLIRFKEHSWSDSTELKPMAHTRLFLIDNLRDKVVAESVSDGNGNFIITVPYFSKYKVRVSGHEKDEHIVSFEIPRYRATHSSIREIVIVKDIFNTPERNDIR